MAQRTRPTSGRNALILALLLATGCGLVAGLGDDRQFIERAAGAGNTGGSLGAAAGTASVGNGGVTATGGSGGSSGAGAAAGAEEVSSGGVRADTSAGMGGGGAGGQSGDGAAGANSVERTVPDGPSCTGMKGTECNGDDCCTSFVVPGGLFHMGRSEIKESTDYFPTGSGDELPDHAVTVSPFALDKFEVNVGRFRRFVDSYDGTPPAVDAGADPNAAASGWQAAWNSSLPQSHDALTNSLGCSSNGSSPTWTPAVSYNEGLPINCLDWFEAFAFCVWDGGRLPTEAEWEFAAAGGVQNRLFPWGQANATYDLAVYDCAGVLPAVSCSPNDILPVGSKPNGNGRYGQADLAGSMWEMTRDSYDSQYYAVPQLDVTQADPVNIDDSAAFYILRGGGWLNSASELRSVNRNNLAWNHSTDGVGMRCARPAQ